MMVNIIPTRTEIQVERYLIGLSSLNTRYAAAMLPTLYPAASASADFVVEKKKHTYEDGTGSYGFLGRPSGVGGC